MPGPVPVRVAASNGTTTYATGQASTGAITFKVSPDFEAPTDAGADNVYNVTVQVSDGANTDTQAIAVSITIGTSDCPRSQRAISRPDSPGSIRSSTTSW